MAEILNRKLDKSSEYWNRACNTILSGTQLYSKGPETHIKGVSPIYIERGKNAHVWDPDGNEYIDYDMGLGPILLGYAYDPVDRAVIDQIKKGMGFSLVSPPEVEYAEFCIENIPCAEKVRFLKTGSSATEGAVRIARAYTGKKHIIRGEYHGWHEWTAAGESVRQGGILSELKQYVHKFEYNDFDELQKLFEKYKGEIAAVITEPVILDAPKNNFLENMVQLCHENGALLIFDEVVDGFRFSIGGAQKYFGVTPDLATFGKAAANGMPLSIIAGKKEIMDAVDRKIFISTTFGGETLSLAAGISVMNELKNKNVTEKIWSLGKRIKEETNSMAERIGVNIKLEGYHCRMAFDYRDAKGNRDWLYNSIFMQECVKRGVLLGWCVFPCYTHTDEDINLTLNVFEDAMKVYKRAIESGSPASFMEGERLKIVLG
ncbi:aminotransferase class III-fold pyridoxal phosphate-dependent enzyme [Clostridium scatologenes]|uniref:Aminotransferase, class III n=1 Tax=Clostridium scatologenes TaxID=1548 RepID=A0A0E3M7F6_CLOSL|nr:aminotransferase class III-fold pyridoxal phosphate-dependent enzyme [Clostridium scatologenes]AKA70307.1 aminotransferase, class III [Clostridium scatologenes]